MFRCMLWKVLVTVSDVISEWSFWVVDLYQGASHLPHQRIMWTLSHVRVYAHACVCACVCARVCVLVCSVIREECSALPWVISGMPCSVRGSDPICAPSGHTHTLLTKTPQHPVPVTHTQTSARTRTRICTDTRTQAVLNIMFSALTLCMYALQIINMALCLQILTAFSVEWIVECFLVQ